MKWTNWKITRVAAVSLSFIFFGTSYAQELSIPDLDQLSLKHAQATFEEYRDLLSLPNDASYPEDIEPNIVWCENHFKERGFTTKRLATGGIPLLLGEKFIDPSLKTVLVYLQLDGQPVDFSKWDQESPWIATLKEEQDGKWVSIPYHRLQENKIDRDWRIFARASSDAKGPVLMFLAAMDALEELNLKPKFNLKVIMDFEEELGSPRLPSAVTRHQTDLQSDLFIIYDGPRHISNKPTLSFGARGIATVTLKLFGPKSPVHSGHYGNFVPNPAFKLSKLLASMKNNEGKVVIPGWYDGINLSNDVKSILRQVPDDISYMQKKLLFAGTDEVAPNYQESLQYPSLNIRGLQSGWVGKEVRTIIPSEAIAEIDIRLVKESNPQRLLGLMQNHIEDQGYLVLDRPPNNLERMSFDRLIQMNYDVSYHAFRTPMDSEIGKWLNRALTKAYGEKPVNIRTMGGSIPISPFVVTLGIPAVAIPPTNPDSNQHSPNENLRLGNYIDGIKTMIAILMETP